MSVFIPSFGTQLALAVYPGHIGRAASQAVDVWRPLLISAPGVYEYPQHSEQHLRREVLGRKNWLFLGSDEGARVNTIFVSLPASCQLHDIEPWAYLRDLLCLLPSWPASRVLELALAFWQQTLQQEDTQQRLATNVFRGISVVDHAPPT